MAPGAAAIRISRNGALFVKLAGMTIPEQLAALHRVIGERPVTVVGVTKYASPERMAAAYEAGLRHFGENKVQDALEKMARFPAARYPDLRWHFIGSLQSNKVNKTLGRFALIHGIDSVRLAQKLSGANVAAGLVQPVLMQVNMRPDPARHGFLPAETPEAARAIAAMPGLSLKGLMTMAPPTQDTAELEAVFNGLRALRDAIETQQGIALPELSMGMSNDFVHALNCGATIIRVGNYLFRE